MKGTMAFACVLLIAVLMASPLAAQGRAVPGGSDGGRGASVGTGVVSSTSSSSSAGYYSGSSYSGDVGMGNRGYGVGYGTTPSFAPNIQGTSFSSVNLYNYWNDYFSYLYMRYQLSPVYFTRFYRNSEPLMTPAMLKMTLRQPLYFSEMMLESVAELETMLADVRAGKQVDRKALLAKSREIRDFAKRIRQDRTLAVYDVREETKLLKDEDIDALDESLPKLQELALDLHRQLTDLYSVSSSSTISVESYKQPSFESVTKGIDKVCKAIEHSSKQL